MLEFGNPYIPGSTFFPSILSSKTIIPTANVRTLFSAPYTFLAGIPNSIILLEKAYLVKQAGIAYTLGAATNFTLRWEAGSPMTGNVSATSMFVDANITTIYFSTFNFQFVNPLDNLINSGIRVVMAGGDLSGGDGDLYIYTQYRVWTIGNI